VFLSLDAHISNQQQQQQHPMTHHQLGGYQQQEQTPLVLFTFHTPWFLKIKDPVLIYNHMKNTSNDRL
jgi:hypothetical protein